MAAPVGVVASCSVPPRLVGTLWRISTVAGAGTGMTPWGAVHEAASQLNGGGPHRVDAQTVVADGGADDVDKGICGADFVEMDIFHGCAVDLGFGLGDLPEDAQAGVFDRVGQFTVHDDLSDVREGAVLAVMVFLHSSAAVAVLMMAVFMPMGMRLVFQQHIHPHSLDTVAGAGSDMQFEFAVETELAEFAPQVVGVHTQVYHCGQVHVAAYA